MNRLKKINISQIETAIKNKRYLVATQKNSKNDQDSNSDSKHSLLKDSTILVSLH